ncbi:MAG: caspase family protein [Hyphomicrobiaceae bacterium]
MRILFLVVFLILSVATGWAADRVALVIGNGDYTVQPKLRNPVPDAVAVADKLRSAGFKVTLGTDLKFDDMRRTINQFATTLPGAKAALLFFAGHGVQVDGENYLIPVDADIQRTTDLTWQTVAVSTLVSELEAPGRTSIFILDACRNNPGLARRLRSLSTTTRALQVGRGLAQVSAPDGSYVAFSTAPNTVALDGEGRHSPFADALIKHLPTRGLDIALMMRRVRRDVRRTTRRQQTPWDSSSLTQPFYFFPMARQEAKPRQPPRPRTGPTQFELSYWDSVKNSKNTRLLESYLEKYPKGHFADLATILVQELKRQWSNEVRQEVEERKARLAEQDRQRAKREREAALKKAQEAQRESAYKKALADAEAARRAQQEAEAKLKRAQAKALAAQQQAALARQRQKAEIEKSDQEKVRVSSLPSAGSPDKVNRDTHAIHRRLQQVLRRLGCYRGRLDGMWGPASARALARAIGTTRAKSPLTAQTVSLVRSSGKACASARQPATANPDRTKPRKPQRTTRKKTTTRRPKNVQNSSECRDWRVCVSTRGLGDPTSDRTKRNCFNRPRGCVY